MLICVAQLVVVNCTIIQQFKMIDIIELFHSRIYIYLCFIFNDLARLFWNAVTFCITTMYLSQKSKKQRHHQIAFDKRKSALANSTILYLRNTEILCTPPVLLTFRGGWGCGSQEDKT